jgi:hypothetical protein
MNRRAILGGAGGSLLAAPAIAQSYPSKPIQMIVPCPPGGGTDRFGRVTSDMLPRTWPADRHPQYRRRIERHRVGYGAARRSRLHPPVQCESVRVGQIRGRLVPPRSAGGRPADRPGGRSAAGAAGQSQLIANCGSPGLVPMARGPQELAAFIKSKSAPTRPCCVMRATSRSDRQRALARTAGWRHAYGNYANGRTHDRCARRLHGGSDPVVPG